MEKALRSSTGLCDINIRFWDAEHQPPRAALTIMHGMAEHVDRYDDFAGFLAQNGIAVAAADMASASLARQLSSVTTGFFTSGRKNVPPGCR